MDFYELLDADELNTILHTLTEKLVYVSCSQDKFIVTGDNSNFVMGVQERILQHYFLIFKILCSNDVIAVVTWEQDVVLIGILADSLHDGRLVWTGADKIYSWPGAKTNLRSLQV